jgi:tetratricopeptide (TPR) repeat protein
MLIMTSVLLLIAVCICSRIEKSNGWTGIQIQPPVAGLTSSLLLIQQQQAVDVVVTVPQQHQEPVTFYHSSHSIETGIQSWKATTLSSPSSSSSLLLSAVSEATKAQPSNQDVALLRTAFATFYDPSIRDVEKAYQLFTEAIKIWENKQLPSDEIFGLYRVRGDVCMALGNADVATTDYTTAIKILEDLLKNNNADDYDNGEYETWKSELVIAVLGRARATKGLAKVSNNDDNTASAIKYAQQSATDYERALTLSSRDDDYDTKDEMILDASVRNPYAAWEWGTALRYSGQYEAAAKAHLIASQSFQEIGDKSRSVISLTDAGIDYAMAGAQISSSSTKGKDKSLASVTQQAETTLRSAIAQTKGLLGSSRDIDLLRRVVAKESEGRIVLASTLWSNNNRQEAETYYGDSCIRLDQLQSQIDIAADKLRQKEQQQNSKVTTSQQQQQQSTVDMNRVLYSIDDEIVVDRGLLSCANFKNKSYLTKTLQWPQSLQQQLGKFEKLQV